MIDEALQRSLEAAARTPGLLRAGAALVANDIPVAETCLRGHLKEHPRDVAAIRMLAEVAARLRRFGEAQVLLERCLDLAPTFDAARHNYAVVLHRQGRGPEALVEVGRLLARQSDNPTYQNLQAAVLAGLGECEASVTVYESVLARLPRLAKVWMSYGHALKTAGRGDESVIAYRRAISCEPSLGEAWWSLANLKTFRFGAAQLQDMCAALERHDLADEDRLHFEFSLGKALEDDGRYAESFRHYAQGNAIRRRSLRYSAEDNTMFVRRSMVLFTREFFAARRDAGAREPGPVFIVGLPRAGSTLLEQILASHSQVEGTMELPDIPRLAREVVATGDARDPAGFLRAVASLSAGQLRMLGETYLARTRHLRKSAAPLFIDKLPNNCLYVGFIHLILPGALIIDARRHPLGCCFSCFKQHFARGQSFTYALDDLGRYYRDYVGLMEHFAVTLPGRIHRVDYETLVADPENTVRRLLAHCRLPFEPGCLSFYQNPRAVRTASSEQVRQPIYRHALEQWRNYEPWLGPLKAALGTGVLS